MIEKRRVVFAIAGIVPASVAFSAPNGWELQHISPAFDTPVAVRWRGADDKDVSVAIAQPQPGRVLDLRPQRGPEDQGFAQAIAAMKGGGEIRLAPGTYEFAKVPGKNDGIVDIADAKDLIIDGRGSTILFDNPGDGFRISSSQRVELRGFTIRYAQPGIVLGRVLKGPRGLILKLDSQVKGNAGTPNLQAFEFKQFDRTAGNSPSNARRQILGRAGTTLVPALGGGYTSAALQGFEPGSSVAVKLGYYQGAGIRVIDVSGQPRTNDITIMNVTVANSSGVGIVADRMGRGFAIVDLLIGPANASDGAVSIPYDGIHVSASAGDILIDHNEIHGTSDDAINIASPTTNVISTDDANTFEASGNASLIEVGSTVTLLDGDMQVLATATVAGRGALQTDGSAAVHLMSRVPPGSKFATINGYGAIRYAVIRNNVDHCACRGVLAQGVNGLIADNHFQNLTSNPIRVLGSAFWKEGGGAANVVIERNTIENTGADLPRDLMWGAISVYSEISDGGSQPHLARGSVNDLIRIDDNLVRGVAQACISVANTAGVLISGNTCQTDSTPQKVVGGSDAWREVKAGIWIDNASTSSVSLR